MTFDEVREDDGLDDLDRALAAGMEESRPIYSSIVTDIRVEIQVPVEELDEMRVIILGD